MVLNETALSRARAVLTDVGWIRAAVVFGSAAGERALRSDSDVDVAICVTGDPPLRDELAVQAELERVFGRAVDLVRMDTMNAVLRWEVARSGRLLWEREAGTWRFIRAEAAIEHDEMAETVARGAAAYKAAILRGAGAPAR